MLARTHPWWAAIVIAVLVNIFGYVENLAVEKGQAYLVGKFVETWTFYEPILIVLSQAFPMPYAAAIALGLDIARRAMTRLKKTGFFTKDNSLNLAATAKHNL